MEEKTTAPLFPPPRVDEVMHRLRREVEEGAAVAGEERRGEETMLPLADGSYPLRPFLAHEGDRFLRHVYRVLLKRDPDPAGRAAFLSAMLGGRLSRLEVMGRVRYSREGRERGVRVRWLLPSCLMLSLARLPLLGTLLRFCRGVWLLPSLSGRLQGLATRLSLAQERIEELEKGSDRCRDGGDSG